MTDDGGVLTTRSASLMEEDHEASSVADILQEAGQNGHQILYLNYKCLAELPSELLALTDTGNGQECIYDHVERLYLKRNLLTYLPSEISRLLGLKELYLHSNHLSTLPDEISELPNLQSLDVSQNDLESLPSSLGRCRSLLTLTLSNNQIKHLPSEIGDLVTLETLILNDNHLSVLPADIGKCARLRSLNVDRNRLRCLPRQLTTLVCLEELSAQGNRLTCVPMDLGCNTDALQSVYVDNNPHLESVPFNLWKKTIGARGCGTVPLPESDRSCQQRVRIQDMSSLLPPEIRVSHTTGDSEVHQVNSLLEITLKFVNSVLGQSRYTSQECLNTLPRDLAEQVCFPISNCSAPNGCDNKIFTVAWVHLLKLSWAQPWQGEPQSIPLVAFLCSEKCYKIFRRIPVPT